METTYTISKTSKIFCWIGNTLLIIMALFHGSGFYYVKEMITQSNAKDFLKDIVPILFAHPSIHLIGLAAFGILSLSLGKESKKVLGLLSIFIIIDALLAFYLGGILPGCLLLAAALFFILAGFRK